jgi:hypothetical protein
MCVVVDATAIGKWTGPHAMTARAVTGNNVLT